MEQQASRQGNGITTAAIGAVGNVLTALPGPFLALCILNAGFIGMVLWFLTAQMEQRTAIIAKMIDTCTAQIAKGHKE